MEDELFMVQRERGQRLGLPLKAPPHVLVPNEIRPDELRDHDREQTLVPYQADLVPVAPAYRLEHSAPRGDLVPLRKTP